MTLKRPIIEILGAALLLTGARLADDFTSATIYVYPEKDFGQSWLGLLILVASLVFVFALAVRRLWQRQVFAGIALLAILIVPFLFGTMIEGHYWRFLIHRTEYQSIVRADPAQSPKYHVFNWGNRNTQLMGGGFVVWAIVYDESDEMPARGKIGRLNGWHAVRASPKKIYGSFDLLHPILLARELPGCLTRTIILRPTNVEGGAARRFTSVRGKFRGWTRSARSRSRPRGCPSTVSPKSPCLKSGQRVVALPLSNCNDSKSCAAALDAWAECALQFTG